MTREVPDGEELFDLIEGRYRKAIDLIDQLLNSGEDLFSVMDGRGFKKKKKRYEYINKGEKDFIKNLLEARGNLIVARERVIKAKIKRARNTFGKWSMMIRHREEERDIPFIRLNKEDSQEFLYMLENPPEPNEALLQAARLYKESIKE